MYLVDFRKTVNGVIGALKVFPVMDGTDDEAVEIKVRIASKRGTVGADKNITVWWLERVDEVEDTQPAT